MQILARVNSYLWWEDSSYRNALNQFDGYHAYPGKLSARYPKPPKCFVEYCHRAEHLEQLEAMLDGLKGSAVNKLIFANEAFLTNGKLRATPLWQRYGDAYIADVYRVCRRMLPNVSLWITDFRCRAPALWDSLRNYLADYRIRPDGIGIQSHIQLGRSLPNGVVLRAYAECIRWQAKRNAESGYRTALSEVTVFPSKDGSGLSLGYNRIRGLADEIRADWMLYWSPTDLDSWNLVGKERIPCGLFTEQGRLKPNIVHPNGV